MASDDELRRQAILDAAGEVFTRKGFVAATTLEIASRASVSKRDLYRLFHSKQGLLDALVERFTLTTILSPDLPTPTDPANFLETLRQFGRVFLIALLHPRRIALYRLAISEAPRSTKLGKALQDFGVAPVTAAIRAFVVPAVRNKILAADDAEIAMQVFFNVLIGSWQIRLLLGVQASPSAEDIEAQVEAAIKALRPFVAS